jgi:peptidase M1-like protein
MHRRPRPQTRLLPALIIATIGLAILPGAALGATLVDRATMRLQTSYLLKASLTYATGTIVVNERITIKNTSGSSISKLNLSVMPRAFGELVSIGSYRVDDNAATARWTNNSNLELQLGRNLANGSSAVVRLAFTVRASSVVGTSLQGRLSKANGIMQVSHWFPIISDGHAARYPGDSQYTRTASKIRLELTTDADAVRIAAPGTRISLSGRSHVYEMSNTRDFAFGASPSYKVLTSTAAGVRVRSFYTTGAGSTALAYAKAALVKFEAAFGQYQWPTYTIAQTGRSSSGNEYPGIVFLGGALFSNREVVAHETAHQWWYAMAGNDQLREPWLDEGIAEFAASYFFGDFHGYVSNRPVNSRVYDFPNEPASLSSGDPNSYDQTIYYKSAKFLEGLRIRMGTTRFFDGMRALFAANRNMVITSQEFVDIMASYGGSRTYMAQFIRL